MQETNPIQSKEIAQRCLNGRVLARFRGWNSSK